MLYINDEAKAEDSAYQTTIKVDTDTLLDLLIAVEEVNIYLKAAAVRGDIIDGHYETIAGMRVLDELNRVVNVAKLRAYTGHKKPKGITT